MNLPGLEPCRRNQVLGSIPGKVNRFALELNVLLNPQVDQGHSADLIGFIFKISYQSGTFGALVLVYIYFPSDLINFTTSSATPQEP